MAFDLTLSGTAAFTSGKYGQALSAGTGITAANIFNGLTNTTLEAWVRNGSTTNVIKTAVGSSGPSLSISETGMPRATANGELLLGTVAINDSQWHHLAVVTELTGTSRFFVDGIIVASVTKTLAGYGTGAVGIGYHPTISNRSFGGNVDEVALSSYSKYTANFTPGSVLNNQANLVAVWHLDGDGVNSAGLAGPAATALVLATGSTTATINTNSEPFTLTANGVVPAGDWTVTPTPVTGVTFTPASAIITDAVRTVSFVAKPTTTGEKVITITNNAGLPSSSFTLTAINPSVTLSGSGGVTGTAVTVTVSSSIPLTAPVSVTVVDSTDGVTLSTVTISPAEPTKTFQFMAISPGNHQLTTTNTGGLGNAQPLSLVFTAPPVVKTAYPTASRTGIRVVKVGSGVGEDFPSPTELRAYMLLHSLVASNEIVIAEYYKDFTLAASAFSPPITGQDLTHYWVNRPVPGYAEADTYTNGTFDYGVNGTELTITAMMQITRGVSFENFRFNITGTGSIVVGGPNHNGTTYPVQVCAFKRNRVKFNSTATSVMAYGGAYNTQAQIEDNLFIRETGIGKLSGSSGAHASTVRRNTFVVRNNTTDTMLATSTASVYVTDNVFVNCGPTPYTGTSSHTKNNYTNMPLTTAHPGFTVVSSGPYVVDPMSDLRLALGSTLIGKGSITAVSLLDAGLRNRGLVPDVGAWQFAAASKLPYGEITGIPVMDGQSLVVNLITANTPVVPGSTAELVPDAVDPQGAITNTGVFVLGNNTAQITFSDIRPGKYTLVITLFNDGGYSPVVGTGNYSVLEIEGSPQATLEGGSANTTPPDAPTNVVATAGLGFIDVTFDFPINDGGSYIFKYIATASTGEVVEGFGSPLRLKNLSVGVARNVNVKAQNDSGLSIPSVPSNSATPMSLPLPGVPLNVVATAGVHSIIVTADTPVVNPANITGYFVKLSTGEEVTVPVLPAIFNDLDLTTRTATVSAVNATGSGPSAQSNAVTPVELYIPTVTLQMVDDNGNPVVGLTDLKWASFDGESPEVFGAPSDQGANESFDMAGKLVVELPNSTKTSGEKVYLVITNVNATTGESYLAFSGQVTVN